MLLFIAADHNIYLGSFNSKNLNFQLRMKEAVTVYPAMIHALFMSIFASVIGPFGGFFASGFKRAFKIKVNSHVY